MFYSYDKKRAKNMKIREFFNKYPDEESCKSTFIEYRIKVGVVCKKCGYNQHYLLQHKDSFECRVCKFMTTLRSGTVPLCNKLPYSYWYIAMYLMSNSSKSISAMQMQSDLSHKRYEPIWSAMHKLRSIMGKQQNGNLFQGFHEMDDAFFVVKTPKNEQCGHGRGSSRTASVLVMAELDLSTLIVIG
jgi:hypothetical protein